MKKVMIIFFISIVFKMSIFYVEFPDAEDLIFTEYGITIQDYLKEKYKDDFVKTVEVDRFEIKNIKNANQIELNRIYENEKGLDEGSINGTCSKVAAAIVIDYYDNAGLLDIEKTDVSLTDRFISIMENCNGKTNGTSFFNVDDLIKDELKEMGANNKVMESGTEIAPNILSLKNHTVIVVGKVTYLTTTKRNLKKEDEFLIVNEGWSNNYGTSYLDSDLIENPFIKFKEEIK